MHDGVLEPRSENKMKTTSARAATYTTQIRRRVKAPLADGARVVDVDRVLVQLLSSGKVLRIATLVANMVVRRVADMLLLGLRGLEMSKAAATVEHVRFCCTPVVIEAEFGLEVSVTDKTGGHRDHHAPKAGAGGRWQYGEDDAGGITIGRGRVMEGIKQRRPPASPYKDH